jgi:prevent-host-death family protein
MQSVTAKELKNRTGAVLRLVRAGATVAITHRGRYVAVISPAPATLSEKPLESRSSEAWEEIDAALAATAPEHSDWREAIRHTRGRP